MTTSGTTSAVDGDRQPGRPTAHLPSPVTVAVMCECFALVLSVAANLVAVWAGGVLAVAAAGALPFLLIGATYLFLSDRIARVWWGRGAVAWYANLAAALAILGPVAAASYWHQRQLLIDSGSPEWIATTLPLAVDGLALRAALTLFRLAHDRVTSAATALDSEQQDAEPSGAQDEPEQTGPPSLPEVRGIEPDVVACARDLLVREPLAGSPRVREHCGVTDYAARKLLAALRPIRAVPAIGGESA